MERIRPQDSSPRPTQRRHLDFTESGSGSECDGMSETPLVCYIPKPTFVLSSQQQNFKCKISTSCKLAKEVVFITECLRDHPNGMKWLKESQFGHLFEVAPYIEMCLTPMWMLLTRRVKTTKKHEIWFVFNGTPIRYSLMEHALISGLNCSPFPQEYPSDESFVKRNFKGKVSLKMVRQKLKEMVIPPGTEGDQDGRRKNARRKSKSEKQASVILDDKLKMAVLYFVSSVLMSHMKDGTQIKDSILQIVEDLEFVNKYPWGRKTFINLRNDVEYLDLKSKLSSQHWSFPGFILPLMLLPFECISTLSPKFARLKDDVNGSLPRICKWSTQPEKKKQAPTLQEILHVVENSKDVVSILTPTLEEKQATHMQGFSPYEESPDTVIDQWMTILDNEDHIFFEDIWREDVEGQRSFLQVIDHIEDVAQPRVDAMADTGRPQTSVIDDTTRLPHVSIVNEPPRARAPQPEESDKSIRMMGEIMEKINAVTHELSEFKQVVKYEFSEVKEAVKRVEQMVQGMVQHSDDEMNALGGDGVDGDNTDCNIPTHLIDEDENVECEDNEEDVTMRSKEVEQNQERPKRKMKKSRFQKTPYTQPPTK